MENYRILIERATLNAFRIEDMAETGATMIPHEFLGLSSNFLAFMLPRILLALHDPAKVEQLKQLVHSQTPLTDFLPDLGVTLDPDLEQESVDKVNVLMVTAIKDLFAAAGVAV